MEGMDDVYDVMESHLKQQCLDAAGLYNWDRKYYRLAVETGILEVIDSIQSNEVNKDNNDGKLSLRGAKYAKEWSILTPALGSFGFDIVWTSGRIWSFLADNELRCRQWVQHINIAIACASGGNISHSKESSEPSRPLNKGKIKSDQNPKSDMSRGNASYDNSQRSQNETLLDAQSPMPTAGQEHAVPPTTLPRYPEAETSKIIMSPARAVAGTTVQAAGTRDNYFNSSLSNISRIPHVAAGSSSSGSAPNYSPESQMSDSANDHENHPGNPSHPSLSVSHSREEADIKPSNLHRGEFAREHASPPRHRSTSTESKKNSTHLTNDVLELEVEELRSALVSVEAEMKERIAALTIKYNEMRDKDRKTISDLRIELEDRAIQVESEGHDVHAAQLRALKETHRREIACLTEDNISERRKYDSMLAHERNQAKSAEQRENEVRKDLIDITTKCHKLESELLRAKDAAVLETRSLTADNERLRRELAQNAEKIGSIRLESESRANESLSATVEKMNAKFSDTITTIERTAYESAKKKFDVQKMQELAAMQIECNRQIESYRAQNKLTNTAELETLKKNYAEREMQTMMDLKHLEALHTRRVTELEGAISSWRSRAEKAEEKAASALMSAAKGSETSRAAAEDTIRQLESHADNVEALQVSLQKKHEELLESRSREASYREHLNRAIEECRVQRAQNLDALRQSSCDGAQAVHWKRVAQELELNLTASNTSMQIARDEAAMLENEVQRLTSQTRSLQDALDRADKIVYGNSAAVVIKSKENQVTTKSTRSPSTVGTRGVSLQDTRMCKRRPKTVFSPVNDENKRASPDQAKRVMMYL